MGLKESTRLASASLVLSIPAIAQATSLAEAMSLARVTPSAMAASGFSVADVAHFVGSIRESQQLASIGAAQSELAAAEADLRAALRGNDVALAAGASVVVDTWSRANAARSNLTIAVQGLVAHATEDLTEAQRLALNRWRDSQPALPPEFRISSWTDAELKQLQRALLEERLAARAQEPLSAESTALLAAARARPEVAAATVNIANMLPAITTAFDAALQ